MKLTKEKIIENSNNGLDIFEALIKDFTKTGKPFLSVFREENSPSANVAKDKDGFYYYKDFGDGETLYPIQFIQKLKGIEFKEALEFAANITNYTDVDTVVKVKKPVQPTVTIYPDEQQSIKILTNQGSPFHAYCKSLTITEAHLLAWNVGTVVKGANTFTCFVYRDTQGKFINHKFFIYQENGSRRKLKPDGKTKDFPFYLKHKSETERYSLCLFGEHLLREDKAAIVCVVESEKTACIAAYFYPQFDWIATGGKQGAGVESFKILQGRKVYILLDADKENRSSKAEKLCAELKLDFDVVDLFPEKTGGYDIADAIRDGLRPDIKPEPKELVKEVITDKEKVPETVWKKVFAMAHKSNREGGELANAIDGIADALGLDPMLISKYVRDVFDKYKAYHGFDNLHIVKKLQSTLQMEYPNLKRNNLNMDIEIDGIQAKETTLNTIRLTLQVQGVDIKKDMFYDVLCSDYTPSYHPIKAFFESNIAINPATSLIKELADCIDSDTGFGEGEFSPDYKERFIKKWLVGSIASVYGYVNCLVLVLAGKKQNTGKTQFFRRLPPPELKRFFTETKLDDMKEADLAMKMCESMYVFDDEMSGKNKQDQKRLKYLTSVDEFTIRRPYQRGLEKTKRLATLCGTSNDLALLNDPTGNRRILPINVLAINHEKYNAIDKTALFMEAYHIFKKSEEEQTYEWELKQADIEYLASNTNSFEAIDKDIELLSTLFEVPEENSTDFEELTASEIAVYVELHTKHRIPSNMLGQKLSNLGFQQKRTTRGGISIRLYIVRKTKISMTVNTA